MAASRTEEEEGGEGGWNWLGVGTGASRRGSPLTVGERRLLLEVEGSGAGLEPPLPRLQGGGEEQGAAGLG